MANPNGPGGSWALVFEDDFSGTVLNTAWWDNPGGTNNNVTSDPANVAVNNGLTLTLSDSATGAEIRSVPGIALQPGWVCEARVWFPGPGAPAPGPDIYNWPAWWTSGPGWPAAGEIDIAEGENQLTCNYHSPTISFGSGDIPGNWSNSWHTYTARRNATSFDSWRDGILVVSASPTADNGLGQRLVLNVGTYAPSGYYAYGAASQVRVAYVRMWQPGAPGTGAVSAGVTITPSAAGTGPAPAPGQAPAFVQDVASLTTASASSAAIVLAVTAASVTPGNALLLWCRCAGTGGVISGVSDSKGNTWRTDLQHMGDVNGKIGFASCIVAPGRALVSGDTITVTLTAAQAYRAAGCAEFSGLAVSAGQAVPDLSAFVSGTGSSVSLSAGPSARASELVISAGGSTGTSAVSLARAADPGSGGTWTALNFPGSAYLNVAYQAAGAVSSFGCTWSVPSGTVAGALLSYAGATVPAAGAPSAGVISGAIAAGSKQAAGAPSAAAVVTPSCTGSGILSYSGAAAAGTWLVPSATGSKSTAAAASTGF